LKKLKPFFFSLLALSLLIALSLEVTYFYLLRQGHNYYQEGKYNKAKQSLQKIVHLRLANDRIHQELGLVYEKQGHWEKAASEYEKALLKGPENFEVHNQLGLLFYKKNELDKAIKELKKSLTLNPNQPETFHQLAIFFYEEDKLDEALSNCQEALSLRPYNQEFISDLNLIIKEINAQKGFSQKESKHFKVFFDPQSEESSADLVLTLLEKAFKKMHPVIPPFSKYKTVVKIYTNSTFENLTNQSNQNIVASAINSKIMLRSPRFLPVSRNLEQILTHEYTHLVLHRLIKEQIPVWLNEGMADFFSRERLSPHQEKRLREAFLTNNLIPISRLEKSWKELNSDQLSLAYAQAYSLADYLVSEFGWSRLGKLLLELSRGKEIEASLSSSLGISYSRLENDWYRHLAHSP